MLEVAAQCNYTNSGNQGTAANCSNAIDVGSYIANSSCETLCFNTGSGSDQHGSECNTGNNSIWLSLYIDNTTNIGDGSLVISFSDYPGATAPVVAAYAEADGIFDLSGFGLGTVNLSIDCTAGTGNALVDALLQPPWLLDGNDIAIPGSDPISGAPCFPSDQGDQTFYDQAILVTPADIKQLLDDATGANNTVNAVQLWLQIEAAAAGEVCFEISDYDSGYTCGDPNNVTFDASSNPGTETQTVSDCLCNSALNGSLNATASTDPAGQCPSGDADAQAVWYQVNAGYACNTIEADVTSWSGAGDVTVAIVSNLNCPTTAANDILGNPLPNPIPGGAVLGYTDEGSACLAGGTGSVTSNNVCLPPGDYWIVVAGVTDRDEFTMDITISEPCLDITNLTIGSGGDVCSEGSVGVTATTEANVEFVYFASGTVVDATIAYDYAANGGTSAGTANSNGTVASGAAGPFPQNATCEIVQYEVYAISSPTPGDPTCRPFFGPVTANVYPEIGVSTATIGACEITVDARCPNFTVDGNLGTSTTSSYVPGDNGTLAAFVVSNGLVACDVIEQPVITCQGNCAPPVVDSVTPQCLPGNNGFEIVIQFSSFGDSPEYTIESTTGETIAITDTTINTYTLVGPYTNGQLVGIKVLNDFDANCNVNLGQVTLNCLDCPSVSNASVNGSAGTSCEGDAVDLVVTTDGGVEGVDYSVQWQLNGVDIPGATSATSNYVFDVDGCDPVDFNFSVVLTCLNGGNPAVSPTSTVPVITVYPIPEFGVDFGPQNCSVEMYDNCGNLTIDNGGATEPAAWTDDAVANGDVTVNYTVSVTGAPAGCEATGSYTANCPDCDDYPGDGTSTSVEVCWGDNFDISNFFNNLSSTGYNVGLAVSSTPLTTAITNTADLNAYADIGVFGPYNDPGEINPALMFSNDGGTFPAPTNECGETYYFVPFVSFEATAGNVMSVNGSETNTDPAGGPFCGGDFPGGVDPSFISTTVNLGDYPYCPGLTTYDMTFCIENVDGYTIDPLTDELLGQQIGAGVYSNFPNIDDIHDSCSGVAPFCGQECYSQNGYTLNPSNEVISITAVIIALTPFVCNQSGTVAYNYNLVLNESYAFPTICPSCNSVGEAVAVTIYPEAILDPIPAPAPICEGESMDLNDFNPNANVGGAAVTGSYTWYEGPSVNGITTATTVVPTDGEQFCVVFNACSANGVCNPAERCFNASVFPEPVVNTPTPDLLCPGDLVQLTSLENSITGLPGSFDWYIGTPGFDGALIANPGVPITPIGTEIYSAVYTSDTAPNCSATVSFSFAYHPEPTLLGVAPQVCVGESVDLTSLQPQLTGDAGVFVWYDDNPNPYPPLTAGNIIADLNFATTDPLDPGYMDGDNEVWVTFTDGTTGCESTTSVTITVNQDPILTPFVAPAVCAGTVVDLTQFNSSIIDSSATPGVFEWFLGSFLIPANLITDPFNFTPTDGDFIFVTFVEDATGCQSFINFNYTVNDLPVLAAIPETFFCNGDDSVDLTGLNPADTNGDSSGTYTWYSDATATTAVADATAETFASGDMYYVVYSDPNGCNDTTSVLLTNYDVLTGGELTYNCDTDALEVDFATVTGGSGTGYAVAASSPNQIGDTVDEGVELEVILTDDAGCLGDTLRVTKACQTCFADAGTTIMAASTVCEGGSLEALANPIPADAVDPLDPATTEYVYVVAGTDSVIVGFTRDGSYDFAGLTVGDTLCFTGLTYDSGDFANLITILLADPTLGPLIGAFGITPASTLEDLFAVVNPVLGPFTIQGILDLLTDETNPSSLPVLVPGAPIPCLDVSDDAYCVAVIDCTNSCDAPTVAFEPDCDNGNFVVNAIVSDLGDGTNFTLSNTADATTIAINATGTYQMGPFADGSTVSLTLAYDGNPQCDVSSPLLSFDCTEACNAYAGVISVQDTICTTDLAAGISAIAIPVDTNIVGVDSISYIFAVTDPAENDSIVDVTYDGSDVDFTGLVAGDQLCFTGIAYSQDELDNIITTLGPLLAGIIPGLTLDPGTDLVELYDLFTSPAVAPILGALGITLTNLDQLNTLLVVDLPANFGIPAPCIAYSNEACIVVAVCTVPGCGTVNEGVVADMTLCNDTFGANPTSGQFTSDGDAGGTWAIDGGASIDANGNVDATGLTPGTYNVTYTVDNPDLGDGTVCPDGVATATLTVEDCTEQCGTGNPGAIADMTLCNDVFGTNPTSGQFTTDGDAGGTWSIDGGASIDASGNVDATGLTAGTYNVSYTIVIADLGDGTVCPDLVTVAVLTVEDCGEECVIVNAGNVADLTLCNDVFGANPTSGQFMSDGDTGGTWAIDGGASIDANGNVDATGLTAGTYNITYTVVAADLGDGTVCVDDVATATLTVENCPDTSVDPEISITDPCVCLDNATTLTDGQFEETVIITSNAGETWTLITATTAYDMSSAAPPAAPTALATDGSVTATEGPAGTYTLEFIHVDAVGYFLEFTNGTDTVDITNNCTYPNPSFNMETLYCSNDDSAITLMVDADGASGTATFTIDGNAATELVPSSLAEGDHTIVATFDEDDNPGMSNPGCIQSISLIITVADCTPPEQCEDADAGDFGN